MFDDNDSAQRFLKHVAQDAQPKIAASATAITVFTGTVDVKIAVELGLSILYTKPIIALVMRGVQVPEHLARVVDRFIEIDGPGDPTLTARVAEAIRELVPPRGKPKGES